MTGIYTLNSLRRFDQQCRNYFYSNWSNKPLREPCSLSNLTQILKFFNDTKDLNTLPNVVGKDPKLAEVAFPHLQNVDKLIFKINQICNILQTADAKRTVGLRI